MEIRTTRYLATCLFVFTFLGFSSQKVYSSGYASVSQGVTINPSTVVLGENFSISFTLKETGGSSISFEKVVIAILKPDGSHLFDFATYSNVTIGANSSWSPNPSPAGQIYTTNPTGTYKAVVRGKVAGGNWFDFTTTGSGVNPRSFSVVPQTGSIRVTLSPNEAVYAGAQWKLDDGGWQNSGSLLSGINVGVHSISFKTIVGWNAPASKSVTIYANQTVNETATYTQSTQYGAIKVDIYPSQAVASGAQWRLNEGTWQNSGTVLGNTPVGSYNLNFKSITGWTAPASKSVTIYANQTINESGTYVQYGSVRVIITPSDAISAGAQWKLDDGVWQNSAVTLSNVSLGSHIISFKPISGWETPSNQNITIVANSQVDVFGNYIKSETPVAINLNVPFKAQYPPGTTYSDGSWASLNCGPTSVLMVDKYYKGGTPTEQDIRNVVDWLAANINGYNVNNYNGSNTNVSTLTRIAKEYLNFNDVSDYSNNTRTIDDLVNDLADYYPVIVAVRINMSSSINTIGHFMVCRGVTADRNTFYFNDPGKSEGNNVSYSRTQFENSWNSQNRACVVIRSTPYGGGTSIDQLDFYNEKQIFYPNPTNGIITFYEAPIIGSIIKIFNTTGQLVFSSTISDATASIDISYLISGAYFFTFVSDGRVSYQKLIKL